MFEKLRKPWKHLIAPIARGLHALGITANAVTIIGAAGTVLAAIVTGVTGNLLVGSIVIAVLVMFDSLDGSVAQLEGGGTKFGAFLDSTLDRVADWAVLVAIIVYLTQRDDFMTLWPQITFYCTLVGIMTSFVTSYARARGEAVGYEAKNGIATRSDRLVIILVGMFLAGCGLPIQVLACFMAVLALLGVVTVWQRMHTIHRLAMADPSNRIPA
ncbi:phosphatidylinositol phosphate synthase [Pseudoscardovia radai]|uniref:phosphatidylinositol phosphate synthase n=1 Tax=Pseudoscardovia radai TaxID=987066 RepID=UPI0039925BE6